MRPESTEITLRIVPLADADLDSIANLVNDAFRVHPLMHGRDRTDAAGLLEEAGPSGRFILAELGARVVGSAMIRPTDANDSIEGYAPPVTALYFGLAGVDTMLMRSGVGKRMLAEAERVARGAGQTHLALNTLYEFDLVPYYVSFGCVPVFDERFDAGHWGLPAPHTLCYLEKPL